MAERKPGKVGAQRLNAAAALLRAPRQAGGWALDVRPAAGETQEQAVLRVIRSLPVEDQSVLKSMVDWVQDYGFDDEPTAGATRNAIRAPAVGNATVEPVRRSSVEDASSMADDVFFEEDEDAVLQALASVDTFRDQRVV